MVSLYIFFLLINSSLEKKGEVKYMNGCGYSRSAAIRGITLEMHMLLTFVDAIYV